MKHSQWFSSLLVLCFGVLALVPIAPEPAAAMATPTPPTPTATPPPGSVLELDWNLAVGPNLDANILVGETIRWTWTDTLLHSARPRRGRRASTVGLCAGLAPCTPRRSPRWVCGTTCAHFTAGFRWEASSRCPSRHRCCCCSRAFQGLQDSRDCAGGWGNHELAPPLPTAKAPKRR